MSVVQSRRRKVYEILRGECGFTHHQTMWLITLNLSHLGKFDEILRNASKKEKKLWSEHAQRIAVLCMRDDPKQSGISVFNFCWPDKNEEPLFPYVCVKEINRILIQAMNYTNSQASTYRYYAGKKILNYERKQAEIAWDERMIMTYLKIKKLL